jgi:hypothetical protein
MKKASVLMIAVALLVACAEIVGSTPAKRPSMDMTGSISASGPVVPGNEFELKLTFVLSPHSYLYDFWNSLQDTLARRIRDGDTSRSSRERYDSYASLFDTAYFAPDTNLELLGASGWCGKIVPGTVNTVTMRARLKHALTTTVYASVCMFCNWETGVNGKAELATGTLNGFSVQIYNQPTSTAKDQPAHVDTLPNGAMIRKLDGSELPPAGPGKKIIKLSDSVAPPSTTH